MDDDGETGEVGDQITYSEEDIKQIKDLSEKPNVIDLLVKSLAPSIWENTEVKKGILC